LLWPTQLECGGNPGTSAADDRNLGWLVTTHVFGLLEANIRIAAKLPPLRQIS